jgi:hypothetical protein
MAASRLSALALTGRNNPTALSEALVETTHESEYFARLLLVRSMLLEWQPSDLRK